MTSSAWPKKITTSISATYGSYSGWSEIYESKEEEGALGAIALGAVENTDERRTL